MTQFCFCDIMCFWFRERRETTGTFGVNDDDHSEVFAKENNTVLKTLLVLKTAYACFIMHDA